MSAPPTTSDRKAAFTGLILGVVALFLLVYGISRLTSAHLDREDGKPAAGETR